MIVVDTNVLSELMRPNPETSVRQWAFGQPAADLVTTAISMAEILYGLARLPDGQRRADRELAATDVFTAFADRILPFDAAAARHYAAIVERRDRLGCPIDGFDAQIAAIAASQGAALATRNVKDFEHTGVDLVDPWSLS